LRCLDEPPACRASPAACPPTQRVAGLGKLEAYPTPEWWRCRDAPICHQCPGNRRHSGHLVRISTAEIYGGMCFSPWSSDLARFTLTARYMKQDEHNPASAVHEPLILVVEDEEDMRQWVLSALVGLSCVTAATVAEAQAALKANPIALMVLDWGLDRCGAEVLQEAKLHYPHMPVIVMSGRPYDVRTDAMVGQADAFLEKPFSGTVLQSQVLQLLRRSEQASATLLPAAPDEIRPLSEVKERYIRHVVALLDGNVSLAAEKLGIHRQTVAAILKRARSLDTDFASQPGCSQRSSAPGF
jgi:DNA-binding response OmpR family regulator